MRALRRSARTLKQFRVIFAAYQTPPAVELLNRHLHNLRLHNNGRRQANTFSILRKITGLHKARSHLGLTVMANNFANKTGEKSGFMALPEDACPQGVQGDDCETFKAWMRNCQRYGLGNCNDQLQGIQSGRKTMAEVMAEQEKLIAEIAAQYRENRNATDMRGLEYAQGVQDSFSAPPDIDSSMRRLGDYQGVQDSFSAFPDIDSPCPQGVQGSDCARYKLWLENCHRFGMRDCMQQYENLVAGRKTLQEIFAEQDKMIESAAAAYQKAIKDQRRGYSTSTDKGSANKDGATSEEGEVSQLTQRQKLQRAVKEYGSTVIVFHVTISLMSLGFFYLLVSSGIDVVGLLMKLGIGETFLQNKLAAGTGTFVVAYAVHKVFAPVRIGITLTSTPFIVRYLRRIGFLKVPKHSKLKE